MIVCVKCGGDSMVWDTAREDGSRMRRRKCKSCKFRWSTIEVMRPAKKRLATKAQIDEILRVYVHQGSVAAGALGISYGFNPHFARTLAHIHGVKRRPGTPKPRRSDLGVKRKPQDPRWERARKIGAVLV